MTRTEKIRAKFEEIEALRDEALWLSENGAPAEKVWKFLAKHIAPLRADIKRLERADKLAKPLFEESRYLVDGDDGSCTEYGFLPADWTEEEVADFMNGERLEINSPYDCTGKRFTWSIDYHKTPVGWAVVHKTALDI